MANKKEKKKKGDCSKGRTLTTVESKWKNEAAGEKEQPERRDWRWGWPRDCYEWRYWVQYEHAPMHPGAESPTLSFPGNRTWSYHSGWWSAGGFPWESCVSLSMLTQNKKFGKRLAWPIQRLVAASSYQTWYGLNCVFPPKWRLPQKKCWGPNPWYLRMWLYLERGSLQM